MTQESITANLIPELPDDLFNIGSISKSDISAIIFKLQEQGIVGLDDTLERWLPEIMSQMTEGGYLTVRELLMGLKRFSQLE